MQTNAHYCNDHFLLNYLLFQESDKAVLVKDGPKRSADHLPDVGNKKRILGDITNQPKVTNLKSNITTRKGSKSIKQDSENSFSSVKNENSISKNVISEESPKKCETSAGDSLYTTALDDRYPFITQL